MTDLELYFKYRCEKGLEKRGLSDKPNYRERLDYEIQVITDMGYINYFLVVANIFAWATSQGIPCGSRGSGAGSLAAYCLEITFLDPIRYGLIFERFLNPERVSMPDFDMDFCQIRRVDVINYVRQKYGEDKVAHIGTYGTMKAKAAIRDVTRALGFPWALGDKLARMTLEPISGKPQPLKVCYEKVPELHNIRYGKDSDGKKVLCWAEQVENRIKSFGTHAAGVVIARDKIAKTIPLYLGKDNVTTCQFEMNTVEEAGLIKFDFLGLRALTTISRCVNMISKRHGIDIDPFKIPVDDIDTFKTLQSGDGIGVFQLENSQGIRDLLLVIKPTCLEDLSLLVAAYRPGPLSSAGFKHYLKVRQGQANPHYLIPELEPILAETQGLCIAEDQKITLPNNSLCKIQDLDVGNYILNSENEATKIIHITNNGTKPIIDIKTDIGRTLKCTSDHYVLTINGYMRASEATHLLRHRFNPGQNGGTRQIEHPWILGLCISDGCLKSSSPVITCGSEKIADIVSNKLAEAFQGTKRKYFNTRAWYAGVKKQKGQRYNNFNIWLRKNQVFGKVKHEKYTPDSVIYSSKKDICKYLAGYIDGDGHVSRYAVHLSCSYGTGRERLRKLLDILGITFYRDGHLLIIRDRTLFKQIIQPHCILKKHIHVEDGIAGDLFINKEHFKSAIDKLRGDEGIKPFLRRHNISHSIYWSKPKRTKIQTLLKALPSSEKENFINTNIRGTFCIHNITSKKQSKPAVVYDLETESKVHNFITEGYIVHNCIYQEQVIEICKQLAGYSMGEADLVRRAIGKKKEKEMETQYPNFISGMQSNGISNSDAEQIWKDIEEFSAYCFNKSHSACYAYVGYQMAWFKTHYPLEFMCSCLVSDSDETDKVIAYISYCKDRNIDVLGPDINESEYDFSITSDNKSIRFGLGAIKNLGKPVQEIIEDREANGDFLDIMDFCNRVNLSKVNKLKLESLVLAGAFDNCGEHNRKSMLGAIEDILRYKNEKKSYDSKMLTYLKKMAAYEDRQQAIVKWMAMSKEEQKEARARGEKKLKPFKLPVKPEEPISPSIPSKPDMTSQDRLVYEKELLGYFVSGHPLDNVREKSNYTISRIKEEATEYRLENEDKVGIVAIPNVIKTITTKKHKKRMAYITLEDKTGTIKAVILPHIYARVHQLVDIQTPAFYDVLIDIIEGDEEKIIKLKVTGVQTLQSVKDFQNRPIKITVPIDNAFNAAKIIADNKGQDHRVQLSIQTDEGNTWEMGTFFCKGERPYLEKLLEELE